MNLKDIPLETLTPSKLNVRKRGAKDITDLVPSIRSHGLLQPLLVRECGDQFEIIAGQRRYHALVALAAEDDSFAAPVPCLVMEAGEDAKAIEASLSENIARLPMDEIDQYKAFSALIREGLTVEEIAARFAVTERMVKQRLAIASIIPPLLTAYRKGDIRPETLCILTMATKAQQKDWLKRHQSDEEYAPTGRALKAWLFGGDEIKTSAALFDLAAYDGAIISDLFGEDSYFADCEAFWAQQGDAIAKARDDYLAEGWAEVRVLDVGEYFAHWEHVDASREEGGKVVIQVAQSGEVTFHEGVLSRKEHQARQGKDAGTTKAEKPELTAPLANYIALHRHAAVRQTLLGHHGLALRLAVAQIIAGSELWSVNAEGQKARKDSIRDSLTANNKAEERFREERQAVAELLGFDLPGDQTLVPRREDYGAGRSLRHILARLQKLSDDEVLVILTFVTAECLPLGSEMVEALGTEMQVSLQDDWAPDQAFYDLLRDKTVINQMVAEVAGENVAAQHITSTGKVQKAVIQACLSGEREVKDQLWQPRYMGFPFAGCKDAAPEEEIVAKAEAA